MHILALDIGLTVGWASGLSDGLPRLSHP